jgi:hypothetical protein
MSVGCCPIQKEEHATYLFGTTVLRRVPGLRRESTGRWINCNTRNSIIGSLLQILSKTERMRWVGHVTNMRDKRNVFKILIKEAEGIKPLRRLAADGRTKSSFTYRMSQEFGAILQEHAEGSL